MIISELTLTDKNNFPTYKDKSKSYFPSLEQFNEIVKRSEIIKNITSTEKQKVNVLDENYILAFQTYRSLPTKAKSQLNNNGKAQNGWWDDDTETFVKGKNAPDSRGILFLLKCIESNFTCAITGLKASNIGYLQIDHIIPLTNGGTDHPSNWLIVDAKINEYKNNNNFDWLINKAKYYTEDENRYHDKVENDAKRIKKKNSHKKVIEEWDYNDGMTLFNKYLQKGLNGNIKYIAKKYKINQLRVERPERNGSDQGNYVEVVYALTRLLFDDEQEAKKIHKECQYKSKLYYDKVISGLDLLNYYADVIEYIREKTGFSWKYKDRNTFIKGKQKYV